MGGVAAATPANSPWPELRGRLAARRSAGAQLLGRDAETARRGRHLLERDCDELAIELAHGRLALQCASEELARAEPPAALPDRRSA